MAAFEINLGCFKRDSSKFFNVSILYNQPPLKKCILKMLIFKLQK